MDTLKKVTASETQTLLNKFNEDLQLKQLVQSNILNLNKFIDSVHKRSDTMAAVALKQSGEGLIIAGTRAIVKGLCKN